MIVVKESRNCPRWVVGQGSGSKQFGEELRNTGFDVTMSGVIGRKGVHEKCGYRDRKRT